VSVNETSPLVVVAAALTQPDGRVLMQQRPVGKAHAGLWEFPGGKVEPGEAPAAALARELAEELGIVVDAADAVPLAFAADVRIVLLLYRVTRWTGEPRAIEGDALVWDVPERLAQLAMPPLDVPLVAALCSARHDRHTA
jgi:8-oxo-dGTP diphosphatase